MNTRMFPILVGALLLLSACGPGNGSESASNVEGASSSAVPAADSRARVEVQGEPTVGPATVVVYVLENGDGVSGAAVGVTGDMTHAGMMPVIAKAVETEPGLYRTEDFRFTMGGDWILTAEIALPDGTEATTRTTLIVPAN